MEKKSHKENREEFDLVLNYEIYEKVYAEGNEPLYEPFLEVIEKIIRKSGFSSILDYGCGNGKVGAYLKRNLKEYDYTLDGLDISQKALEEAKKYYDAVLLSDGETLPARRYDIILLNSIIEHISADKLEILFNGISKATDSVFIVVPNFNSPRRLLKGRTRELKLERDVVGHVNFLSRKDIIALLKRYGFSKIQFSFCQRFKGIQSLTYRLFGKMKLLYRLYFLLSLYPFYFLRDSFWIYAKKK